jgi:hypothetical protein
VAATLPQEREVCVDVHHFTTTENGAWELMVEGSNARPDVALDTFAVGLCFLHLLTGDFPYEEILESVRCPDTLRRELRRVWDVREEPYHVVRWVLRSEGGEVLYDTLYRFLVLFGEPAELCMDPNPVWRAVHAALHGKACTGVDHKSRCDSVGWVGVF